MSLSIISFTENGVSLSERVAEAYAGRENVMLYTKCSRYQETVISSAARNRTDLRVEENQNAAEKIKFVEKKSIVEWAGEQMELGHALLFIGACGIAVRAISPYVSDKLHDSPVLVMDEKGQYIIPILSGHMGGANEIAVEIAKKTGAVPVITTATDLNQKFAVDVFAKKNHLSIVNREGIAKVSAKVLAGREITISVETGYVEEPFYLPEGIKMVSYPPEKPVDILVTTEETDASFLILLKPREYVIGMGCKKGKEPEKIEMLINKSTEAAGLQKNQIYALASIDRKKEEAGFLLWSRKTGVPFLTFSAEQLQKVEGDFSSSAFVKEKTGIDNVCERAAVRACGMGGKLIYKKHAEDGMTIAIAKREWSVFFDEE